jgi:hypothetical protein
VRLIALVVFWVYAVSALLRIISLWVEEYPRTRSAVGVPAEITGLLFEIAVALYVAHVLWLTA